MNNNNFSKLETLLSTDRICNLIKYSEYASRLNGAVAEFGVFNGGSLEILAKFNTGCDVFGLDSFSGLPKESDIDFHREGDFNSCDYHSIAGYFRMIYQHVKILRGYSPDIFNYFDDNFIFRFVHLDVDLYQSVLDGLNFFVPHMVTGGAIVIDDFKLRGTRGCEKAINDFFEKTDIKVSHREELKYFSTESSESHHQYLIIK